MTFLDAQALVAFMVGEPAADEVEAILARGDARIASINLAETIDIALRVHGVPRARLVAEMTALNRSALEVVDCDEARAARAGELRARHYRRRDCPVSTADCVLVASTAPGDAIATSDGPVLEVARAEGVAVIPLPDSQGKRPR